MSSLAAAQADGYYNPPEWDPRKGSLKKFTGAKGHNQYLQKGECGGGWAGGRWPNECTWLVAVSLI